MPSQNIQIWTSIEQLGVLQAPSLTDFARRSCIKEVGGLVGFTALGGAENMLIINLASTLGDRGDVVFQVLPDVQGVRDLSAMRIP